MSINRKTKKLIDRKLLEKVSDYTIVNLNEDGKIEDWNESAKKILGYAQKEVKGSSFRIFFNDEDKDPQKFRKLIDKAVRLGRSSVESVLVKKDHTTFVANILISSIYDDDHNIIGFSVIVGDTNTASNGHAAKSSYKNGKDLNEVKFESLRKEFDKVSNSISHDLKAPIRAIDGYLRIFSEEHLENLDDNGKRMIANVQRNSKRMASLIENLVAYSRVCTRKLTIEDIHTQELMENILHDLKKHGENEVKILHSDLPVIRGDYSLMNAMFTQLLDNAVKFSSRVRHPQVKISSVIKDGNVIFTIEDNGAGFDMKYAGTLFETFQKLHDSDEFEGSGIGLALVKLIVSKHDGKIWADSEPDKGARFYVSLPVAN